MRFYFYQSMKKRVFFITAFIAMVAMNVHGQKITAFLGGGIEFGGDEVYELFFTNGESSIGTAGQGGFLEAGGQCDFEKIPAFFIRGSAGFKFLLNPTENAATRFTRIPINFSGNWMFTDDIRFGAGFTKHFATRVIGDGFVADKDFTTSLGPRFELAYRGLALSYTFQNYTDQNNIDYSANCIGISYSGTIKLNKS